MYNKVILVGNLTRDIELRYGKSGVAIASTAIASSRKFTSNGEKKEEIMYIDITFFGRSAEVASQYLRKGSKILVEGRIQLDKWVDLNGGTRSKHVVSVEVMQMLDSKSGNQQEPHSQQQQQQQPQQGYGQGNGNSQRQNVPVYQEQAPQQDDQLPF